MIKAPCKGCTDRVLGCHGKCDRYKAYRARIDSANEKKRRENDIEDAVYAGKERLLSESCLQPGSVYHSRKLSTKNLNKKCSSIRRVRREEK